MVFCTWEPKGPRREAQPIVSRLLGITAECVSLTANFSCIFTYRDMGILHMKTAGMSVHMYHELRCEGEMGHGREFQESILAPAHGSLLWRPF